MNKGGQTLSKNPRPSQILNRNTSLNFPNRRLISLRKLNERQICPLDINEIIEKHLPGLLRGTLLTPAPMTSFSKTELQVAQLAPCNGFLQLTKEIRRELHQVTRQWIDF